VSAIDCFLMKSAATFHCWSSNCRLKLTMVVPCLRWLVAGLSLRRPGFAPGSFRVGFVMDRGALGQAFLRVLRFSLSIHSTVTVRTHHLGDEQWACWMLHFRDKPQPIDMNNNYHLVGNKANRYETLLCVLTFSTV
jgi:hypothetical protein